MSASLQSLHRLRAHLLGQLVCLGRHTLTGLLATNGQLQRDWTADYRLYARQRIDAAELFGPIRRAAQQSLAPQEALTVAMDDSILRKSGRHYSGSRFSARPLKSTLPCQFCTGHALCAALGLGASARRF